MKPHAPVTTTDGTTGTAETSRSPGATGRTLAASETSRNSGATGRTVVVTGAAGATGRAVIAALADRGVSATALVHRAGQIPSALAAGAGRAVAVELTDRAALADAIGGAGALYHVPPNMHPDEDGITRSVIETAQRCGVGRFVLHSVLAPHLPAMPHHLRKAESEAVLRCSALTWTILQPGWYAQNLLAHLPSARAEGVIRVPYSASAPFTPVDLADVAEAAAAVLTGTGHEFACYELSGPATLSTHEMAEVVAGLLGVPVRAERQSVAHWRRSTPGPIPDGFEPMFRHYDRHGLVGNPSVLAMLLGRSPTDLRAVLTRRLGVP
ncbi:NAD(P)H-binding protein [Streptosporangium sp. NPDC051022]|uniref:SDR family oxidoreductase n=1 Tax=Streptosporangium sp. NPDC051022 TaxID=3155752 RepID=UPI00343C54A2